MHLFSSCIYNWKCTTLQDLKDQLNAALGLLFFFELNISFEVEQLQLSLRSSERHTFGATSFGGLSLSVGLQLTSLFPSLTHIHKLFSFILPLFLRRAAPSAEFSVDRTRHIMSFLTMLGPSPDWNVGLSAEDLCTKECGWVQRVVQDLIPWDAGTDSGVTYEVSNTILVLITKRCDLLKHYVSSFCITCVFVSCTIIDLSFKNNS